MNHQWWNLPSTERLFMSETRYISSRRQYTFCSAPVFRNCFCWREDSSCHCSRHCHFWSGELNTRWALPLCKEDLSCSASCSKQVIFLPCISSPPYRPTAWSFWPLWCTYTYKSTVPISSGKPLIVMWQEILALVDLLCIGCLLALNTINAIHFDFQDLQRWISLWLSCQGAASGVRALDACGSS